MRIRNTIIPKKKYKWEVHGTNKELPGLETTLNYIVAPTAEEAEQIFIDKVSGYNVKAGMTKIIP